MQSMTTVEAANRPAVSAPVRTPGKAKLALQMLHDPRTLASGRWITLVLGVRYKRGLLYREEFERIERQHPSFRFVPVLSRPTPGRVAGGMFSRTCWSFWATTERSTFTSAG